MRSSILAVLSFLAVSGLTASVGSAGPNAGGVLWVHDTDIVFSTDSSLPPVSTPPADCAGVDNQQDADGVDRIWKVYAAFPEGSSPQLKSTGFGTRFPDALPDPYITMNAAGCGAPPGVTWSGTHGFPTASGGEVWLDFDSPVQTTVVELFYLTGSAGTGQPEEPRPLTWCTFFRSSSDENVFLDDALPQHVDPILGYGCLGFGEPGSTPCPQPAIGCCCAIAGLSQMTTEAGCSGYWAGAGVLCSPDPCPAPCCDPATGACVMTTQPDCVMDWRPELLTCEPNSCPPPTGCCCRVDGSFGVTTQAGCMSPDDWFAGSTCNPPPCLQPPPLNDICEGAELLPPCLGLSAQGDAMWANDDYNPQPPFPGCTGSGAPGRDVVFELNMIPGQAFTVTYTRTASDASIYLVTDCSDPGNSCVIGADAVGIGEAETLAYTSIYGGTYYLILDARTNDGGGIPVHQPWTMSYSSSCPTGCCCDHTGASRITTQPECTELGFEWLGADVPCTPVNCPPWAPCCLGDGASHCWSEVDCLNSSGIWLEGEPCIFSPDPCLRLGVCCNYAGVHVPDCTITTAFDCRMPKEWHSDWPLVCLPDPCSPTPLTGSCCYSGGICAVTTQVACTGTWHEGGACEPNPCAQPPAQGACCDHATGSCTITVQAACQFTWLGAGVLCDSTTCIPPTPVERKSWGQIKNTYR